MQVRINKNHGFTAVELLVAIIVGVTLVGAAFQLYSVALTSSGDAQRRSQASNVAYDILRNNQTAVSNPCSTGTSTPAIPTDSGLTGATASLVKTCPYNEYNPDTSLKRASAVTLLTVTITYDSGSRTVTRAIAVAK
jgi:prepilin-type N-terminal cleavage/methylation domain-containing protein